MLVARKHSAAPVVEREPQGSLKEVVA
jgi:hypothetical protein